MLPCLSLGNDSRYKELFSRVNAVFPHNHYHYFTSDEVSLHAAFVNLHDLTLGAALTDTLSTVIIRADYIVSLKC